MSVPSLVETRKPGAGTSVAPASRHVKRLLRQAARALATSDPTVSLHTLLEQTFERPLEDPAYRDNRLVPGSLPLECSFSERARDALRLDLQPFDPLLSARKRREQMHAMARRLIARHLGGVTLAWFDQRSQSWRETHLPDSAQFGAFFGASFDGLGVCDVKIYYELSPTAPDTFPAGLAEVVRSVESALPGLSPRFGSVACCRAGGLERVYLIRAQATHAFELAPVFAEVGLGHRFPAFADTMLRLFGGGTFPGSTVVSVCGGPGDVELKVEVVLASDLALRRSVLERAVLLLRQRSDSGRTFKRWQDAVPECQLTVAGVRITAFKGPLLNLYATVLRGDAIRSP